MGLIDDMLNGSQRALSRLITLSENDEEARQEIIKRIFHSIGNAHIVGITGPPGVGKSTTVDAVVTELRGRGKRVGVIAVDPSSPFSQGAVLGDRIRMQGNDENENLFIRSLASRGKLGGLSKVTNDVVKLLDAFGMDVIIIETVGTGQSEYEIAKMAHTTVIVLSPGYGDGIQAIKAGILETGDIFIVNKADMNGAAHAVKDIVGTVEFNFAVNEWTPPVIPVIAKKQEGIEIFVNELENHYNYLKESNLMEKKSKDRIEQEIEEHITSWIETNVLNYISHSGQKQKIIEQIYQKMDDPISLIHSHIKEMINGNFVK
ncbi:methylmalonyl Co-A mutase-associated GTPase MeaB [Neobacillus novalis]|uniref:Methylmalonyl Co-A mutase-associated GTPase MeaB n=1 Tax=Neobacillus novalis TaxID=220687 RepID=A0AA95SAJ3_9BACI|nr:methylmalonyl Co-A mutase-associated GTPase MeaB [Neobacillus novalis]WHY83983.1 methylmalonyl Co-A mutase-associated GTPase MeaB [Neobacillus novalis]